MSGYKYLIERHDGKRVSLWDTRHDAVGWEELYHDCNDYTIRPILPVALLHLDVRSPDHENRVANRGW